MEMIAFVSDGTKETTLKIIKTLKQLGADDRLNLEINTTKNFKVGIEVKNLYYFISEICAVIHCSNILPEDYTLLDIETFDVNLYKYPIIVQSLVDKKAETNNTIDLDAYANGVHDCFNTYDKLGIYTEADVLKLLTDFKNSFGLYRGIQILDSDVSNWLSENKKK